MLKSCPKPSILNKGSLTRTISSPLKYPPNYPPQQLVKKPPDSQRFFFDKRTMQTESPVHPSKALQQKRPTGYQTPICLRTCSHMAGHMHGQQGSIQPGQRLGTKASNKYIHGLHIKNRINMNVVEAHYSESSCFVRFSMFVWRWIPKHTCKVVGL